MRNVQEEILFNAGMDHMQALTTPLLATADKSAAAAYIEGLMVEAAAALMDLVPPSRLRRDFFRILDMADRERNAAQSPKSEA